MNRKIRIRLFIVVVIFFFSGISILAAEIFLRNALPTSSFLDYKDVVDGGLKEGGLLVPNFNGQVIDGLGGEVLWVNNSSGFRNRMETSLETPLGVKRILGLEDSFAAGYRVGQNETYSFLIEKRLNKKYPTEVLISLIEDLVLGLEYLEKFGYRFKPDLVLLGFTIGNDLTQTYSARIKDASINLAGKLSQALIPSNCIKHGLVNDLFWRLNYLRNHSRILMLLGLEERTIVSRYGSVLCAKSVGPRSMGQVFL